MKNKMMKFAGAAALALALAQTVQATPLSGNIGFTGVANLDTTSAQTATTVLSWTGPTLTGNPIVTDGGVIATLIPIGSTVPLFSPWNFTSGSPVASFWSFGGVTFTLSNYSFTRTLSGANWSVALSGIGSISAAGYTATPYSFSVTFQDPATPGPSSFTFSASQAPLPDGGTTALLLGSALSGLALMKRKLKA